MVQTSKIKIQNLRKKFLIDKIDGYILPSTDEYLNEFVPERNLRLNWLTNFSGSNGLVFLTQTKLLFFTDGRYLLQSKKQLIKEFEIFDSSKINLFEWIEKNLKNKNLNIRVDTKINNITFIKKLEKICERSKNNIVLGDTILIDSLWHDRPKEKLGKVYFVSEKYSGISAKEKLSFIKNKVRNYDFFLVTSPESISWLLNIRGSDLDYTPITFCRLIISKNKKIKLFINDKKIDSEFKNTLEKKLNISVFKEELIEDELKRIPKGKQILLDKNSPYFFFQLVSKDSSNVFLKQDPIKYEKSKKNKTEIIHSKKSHLHDGVALANFFCWLDENSSKKKMNEVSIANTLEEFRKKNNNFISLSFPTISAFGSNSAIIHYQPNDLKNKTIKEGGVYLCDSGGQYIFGTTDVTRTIIIGKRFKGRKKIKDLYTRVLIGHINLSIIKFPKETKGVHLDAIARNSLWKVGLDYAHGTGHGVGSFLSVHEGPQSISKSLLDVSLEPGMIISNEPGFYKNNEFGIRIENLILVKNSKSKGFLEFETLTLAPYQTKLIIKSMLNKEQREWINNYHKKVYNTLAPSLNSKVKKWLFDMTLPI